VKKLSKIHEFSERQFEDELICLIKVKHKNIVRFLGYCSDTSRQVVKHNGTYILAEVRRRFLCFEYVPNKSLKEYLKGMNTATFLCVR
jgi:serine/threonine protein kinase